MPRSHLQQKKAFLFALQPLRMGLKGCLGLFSPLLAQGEGGQPEVTKSGSSRAGGEE